MGTEFISFLLNLTENPPDTDLDDQIPDLFVNLILSYNLQFHNGENIVLEALKERTVAKTFTEKILLLLNRESKLINKNMNFKYYYSHSVYFNLFIK